MTRFRLAVAALCVTALAVTAVGTASQTKTTKTTRNEAVSGSLSIIGIWTGPEQKRFQAVLDGFERFDGRAPLAVAVFTSAGCSLCAALEPSLRLVGNDPEVELLLFDEQVEAEVWSSLAVPGSPYAVVLGRDGEVLAKGTFNSLFQLESLIAHAARRVGA